MRVTLTSFLERYQLAERPSGAPPAVQDAHRQTRFLLGDDLTLFERAMNLQLAVVAANAKARPGGRPSGRDPQAAALLGLWSRAFAALADSCLLLTHGSYTGCPHLLRTACDCIAAQRSLIADGFGEYEEWLAGAFGRDRQHQALSIQLGRFRAGSALARDQRLGALYRLLTDLAMPHFGSTALLVAPDASLQRMGLAFADGTFHLGWAELVSGWLLSLAAAQLETIAGSGALTFPEDPLQEWRRLEPEVAAAASNPRRCRAEEVDGRFLLRNFRRAPGGAPKRLLLA